MKRSQLPRHLRRHGCALRREGANHSIYQNTSTGDTAPVPRRTEIAKNLARRICKDLKIPSP
ncbi:MAG: type II toxin-antitoxin system HicA family toxin [Rubrobacteraceae bacterium]